CTARGAGGVTLRGALGLMAFTTGFSDDNALDVTGLRRVAVLRGAAMGASVRVGWGEHGAGAHHVR
ncbi:MAG: hypothetical protein WAZ18_04380, partial [Alphaproteobacteria bacterium]